MSLQEWECLVAKKLGDDVSGDFASNAGANKFNGIADFADDMTSYADQTEFDANWIPNDTARARGNPATDVIDFTYNVVSVNGSIAFDLWSHGIFPSDTNWTLRFLLRFSTLSVASNAVMYIGLSSEGHLSASSNAQDGIFLKPRFALSGRDWRFIDTDGVSPNSEGAGDLINAEDPAISTDYYCEIKRTSATTFEATVFNDANFSDSRFKGRNTTLATVADLRYIKILNINVLDVGNMTGTITDVTFFNNSEGTTDKFVLHGDEDSSVSALGPSDFFDDFSTYATQPEADTAWPTTNTGLVRVNITNDNLDFNWGLNNVNLSISHDLGIGFVDNETWTLDGKIRFSSLVAQTNTRMYLGLSDEDETFNIDNDIANRIFLFIRFSTGFKDFSSVDTFQSTEVVADNNVQFTFLTGVDYFWRVVRESLVGYHVEVFTDSARTISLGRATGTINPALQNLRYIIFQNIDAVTASGMAGTIDDVTFYNSIQGQGLVLDEDFSTYGTPVNPDFVDVFDSDAGWTTTNSTRVRVEDDQGFVFAMSPLSSTSDVRMSFDLGALINPGPNIISDTEWVVRFKLSNTLIEEGADATSNIVGFSLTEDNQTTNSATAQDHITFVTRTSTASVGVGGKYEARAGNELSLRNPATLEYSFDFEPLPMTVTNSLLFVEMRRTSSTTMEINLYADSSYSDLIEASGELTISASILNLRYLTIWEENNDGTANGQIDQTFDDVCFWDNRSTTCDPVLTTLFSDDFVYATQPQADAVWTIVGTGIEITAPSTVMDYDGQPNSTNVLSYHDLGVLPEAFRLRFKIDFTTVTAVVATSAIIGIGLSDVNTARSVAQDMIDIEFSANSSTGNITRVHSMVNNFPGGGTTIYQPAFFASSGVTRFIELIRLNATQGVFTIYTDSSYTTVEFTSGTISLGNNPSALRFLKLYRPDNFTNTNTLIGTIDDVELTNNIPWVSSDPDFLNVDICQENLQAGIQQINSNSEVISLDLVTPLSDAKWVMRFSYFIGDFAQLAGADLNVFVGMSDNDSNSATSQDYILFRTDIDQATLFFAVHALSNSVPNGSVQATFSTTPTLGTIYLEIIRESATQCRITIFSDENYTFPIESELVTITSALKNLRFVKVMTHVSTGSLGNIWTSSVDDIKIWDGVDVADSFGARRYLQTLQTIIPNGVNSALGRFNLDESANNGSIRSNFNNEATDQTSSNRIFAMAFVGGIAGGTNFTTPITMESVIYNRAEDEKIVISHQVGQFTLGASFPPDRCELASKWTNVITGLSRIEWTNGQAGSYDTDTEWVVFGSD